MGRRREPGPRSLATDCWQARGRGRPTVGVAGPERAEVFLGGPCRAARQAELAAQARPGARAVLGPGQVTSGPCRAWAVPGRPCSGRANGPRAVRSSIGPTQLTSPHLTSSLPLSRNIPPSRTATGAATSRAQEQQARTSARADSIRRRQCSAAPAASSLTVFFSHTTQATISSSIPANRVGDTAPIIR